MNERKERAEKARAELEARMTKGRNGKKSDKKSKDGDKDSKKGKDGKEGDDKQKKSGGEKE